MVLFVTAQHTMPVTGRSGVGYGTQVLELPSGWAHMRARVDSYRCGE